MFWFLLLVLQQLTVVEGCKDAFGSTYCISQSMLKGCNSGAMNVECKSTCGFCHPSPKSCAGYTRCDNSQFVVETNFCFADPCIKEDKVNCCSSRASCQGYAFCDATETLVSSNVCDTISCSVDDRPNCCLPKLTCDGAGFNLCDSQQYVIIGQECTNNACTIAQCCDKMAPCSDYTWCEATWQQQPYHFCHTDECNQTLDHGRCCERKSSCAGFSGCDAGEFVRTEEVCDGLSCDPVADKNICCGVQSTCDGYTQCDVNQFVDPASICTTDVCDIADKESCCVNKKSCQNFSFCDGTTFVDDTQFCASNSCVLSDTDTCCQARETCDAFTGCDEGDDPKAGALCATDTCNASDKTSCCENTCLGFQFCEPAQLVIATNHCVGMECAESDKTLCCGDRGTCVGFALCPADKAQHGDGFCATDTCGAGDVNSCCNLKPSCFGYPHCTASDVQTPEGLCQGTTCADTADDRAACCEPRSTCADFTGCGANQDVIDTNLCAGTTCQAIDDKAACCADRASCQGYGGCSSTQFVKTDSFCLHSPCVEPEDNAQCCGDKGACGDYRFCVHNSRSFEYVRSSHLCAKDKCTYSDRSSCCGRCTLSIRGVLNTVDECPVGKTCTPRVQTENYGADFFTLDKLGSFQWTICPGDSISLSASGIIPELDQVFLLCTVANGVINDVWGDMNDVFIQCDSPMLTTLQPIPDVPSIDRPVHPCQSLPAGEQREECEESFEFEGMGDDQYWAQKDKIEHPSNWYYYWYGESSGDLVRLSRSKRMKEQAIRSKLKLTSKNNNNKENLNFMDNINKKNSKIFGGDISWIIIGYASTLIFFLLTLVIYFKCIKQNKSSLENEDFSSLTFELINELNNHDNEAIILE